MGVELLDGRVVGGGEVWRLSRVLNDYKGVIKDVIWGCKDDGRV